MSGRIFISYSHSDSEIAEHIAFELEKHGLEPWIDRKEVQPGDSFIQKINEGLEESSYLIVLFSPSSLSSHWVNREWSSSLANKAIVLIPVIIAQCKVPAILKDVIYFDLRKDKIKGIDQLVDFFQREASIIKFGGRDYRSSPGAFPPRRPKTISLRNESRRIIRLVAIKCLSQADFSAICFDFEINLGQICGNSLHERLISLLHITDSEGLLESLIDWLELERARCVRHQLSILKNQQTWP